MTLQSANAGNSRATLDSREERQHKNRRLIFEREFFSLAGTWLACRLEVMGGYVTTIQRGPLEHSLLGSHDYQKEMELLIREVRG
jgi:hypothetical protein